MRIANVSIEGDLDDFGGRVLYRQSGRASIS